MELSIEKFATDKKKGISTIHMYCGWKVVKKEVFIYLCEVHVFWRKSDIRKIIGLSKGRTEFITKK